MTDVRREQLNVPDKDKLQDNKSFELVDNVIIALSQAYCPNGHNLIDEMNPAFLGFPGMTVEISTSSDSEIIIVSPVHGHHQRIGGAGIADGAKCGVGCPECHQQFPEYEEKCSCGAGNLRVIYLTPKLDAGDHVLVCDVWGCHRSRVVDRWELLSEFVETE